MVLDYTLKIRQFYFDKYLSTRLKRQKTFNKNKQNINKSKRRENKNLNFNLNEISGVNLINKNSINKESFLNINQRFSLLNKNNLEKLSIIQRSNSKDSPIKIYKIKKEKN